MIAIVPVPPAAGNLYIFFISAGATPDGDFPPEVLTWIGGFPLKLENLYAALAGPKKTAPANTTTANPAAIAAIYFLFFIHPFYQRKTGAQNGL
jgi:hypothetical protein